MREFFITVLVFASIGMGVALVVQENRLTAAETRIQKLEASENSLTSQVSEFSNFRVDMKDLGVKLDRLQGIIAQEQSPVSPPSDVQTTEPTQPVSP
jgi:hypothetical protein